MPNVGMLSNMKATLLLRRRVAEADETFAEYVIWQLPQTLPGSAHPYKYRLAYVVDDVCVLRYDNESGKGDHRHVGAKEGKYTFTTPGKLIADFERDIKRWDYENRSS